MAEWIAEIKSFMQKLKHYRNEVTLQNYQSKGMPHTKVIATPASQLPLCLIKRV